MSEAVTDWLEIPGRCWHSHRSSRVRSWDSLRPADPGTSRCPPTPSRRTGTTETRRDTTRSLLRQHRSQRRVLHSSGRRMWPEYSQRRTWRRECEFHCVGVPSDCPQEECSNFNKIVDNSGIEDDGSRHSSISTRHTALTGQMGQTEETIFPFQTSTSHGLAST